MKFNIGVKKYNNNKSRWQKKLKGAVLAHPKDQPEILLYVLVRWAYFDWIVSYSIKLRYKLEGKCIKKFLGWLGEKVDNIFQRFYLDLIEQYNRSFLGGFVTLNFSPWKSAGLSVMHISKVPVPTPFCSLIHYLILFTIETLLSIENSMRSTFKSNHVSYKGHLISKCVNMVSSFRQNQLYYTN